MFYSKLAILVARLATSFFVDDAVSYRVVNPAPVVDSQTGIVIVSIEPSEPIGCDTPRLTIDTRTETLLAVHCRDIDGNGSYYPYVLLAE